MLHDDAHVIDNKDSDESAPPSHHHIKRIRMAYEKNNAASLALPINTETLHRLANHPASLFATAKNNIIHHAATRIDLFFYILVAYYKSRLTPKLGRTFWQYGKGRKSANATITEACHSSFISNLIDDTTPPNAKRATGLLADTHLLLNLNSTVELPTYVNELDGLLEAECREKALVIIQDVAKGFKTPIDGLTHFFILLAYSLKKVAHAITHNSSLHPKQLAALPTASTTELIQLIEQGSFKNKWDYRASKLNYQYIDLLLRVTPTEKAACLKNSGGKQALYEKKIMELQKEILGDNIKKLEKANHFQSV